MTDSILSEALASFPPGRYEIPVRGGSMLPTLREGDVLLVAFPPGAPRLGDILLVRHGDMTFAHRYVGRIGARILTKGDAHAGLDGWTCTARDVLGRVTAVRPSSEPGELSLESARARFTARVLGLSGLAIGSLFAIARRLDALGTRAGDSGPFRSAVGALNRLVALMAGGAIR